MIAVNKETYLRHLKRELRCLKPEEKKRQLEYFEEMISDMTESGREEEEAIKQIGDPAAIARQILSQMPQSSLRKKDRIGLILFLASLMAAGSSLAAFLNSHLRKGISFFLKGSDGPTSIFIAGKIGQSIWLYGITCILVLSTMVYFWKKKHLYK